MAFADLTARLNLNTAGFTSAMNNARRQAQRFSSYLAQEGANEGTRRLIDYYNQLNSSLHRVGLSARDVARIMSGILVSQSFYTIANQVRDATSAVWEFTESLDYAYITYSTLMGSTEVASDFLRVLQQYSIDTMFGYSDLEQMSRKLLAYGIEYKNLMYIIEGLTNIGTLTGDTAALDRLALAIGQINAKGTLKAEEVRQLTNAYAPMYDILREKFNLSEKDFKSIGDLGLPADAVINAIVEYANEQFGDMANAATMTITGLNNRIVDVLKVMGAEMMQPLANFYKAFAASFNEYLNIIYDTFKSSGMGGVFEQLIPNEAWQARIREFIANIQNAISSVVALIASLRPYVMPVIGAMVDAFNILYAAINLVRSALVGILQFISADTVALTILTKALSIAAAAWVLFRARALAATAIGVLRGVLLSVANAVLVLTRVIMANPLVAGLLILGGVLVGLSSRAAGANSAISNLLDTLSSHSIGGNTADDILQVGDAVDGVGASAAKGSEAADQFWNAMGDGADGAADSLDKAGNAAKKAAKKVNGLLSFDEVFKLPEPSKSGSGSGSGVSDALAGMEDLAKGLSGLGGALIPEIPSLKDYANRFVSTLYNDLWESIKTIASGAATGALLGGLVGFTIGGFVTRTLSGALAGAKLGAKIGAIAGAAFAGFWTDSYEALEKPLRGLATGGAIGGLVGGLAGMVIGAFATKNLNGALAGAKLGSKIGTVLGAGIGAFWGAAKSDMEMAINNTLAGGKIGLGVAFAKLFTSASTALAVPFSSVITSLSTVFSSGSVAGAFDDIWAGLAKVFTKAGLKSLAKGGLIGAAIGFFVDGLAKLLWNRLTEVFKLSGEATGNASIGQTIGGVLGTAIGAIIGGPVGMALGSVIGTFAGGFAGLFWEKVEEYFNPDHNVLSKFILTTAADLSSWWDSTKNGFSAWASSTWNGLTTWLSDTLTGFLEWDSDTLSRLSEWWDNTVSLFSDWNNINSETLSKWWHDTKKGFTDWWTDTKLSLAKWYVDTSTKFVTWQNNTFGTFLTWWGNTEARFNEWVNNIVSGIINWANSTFSEIIDWASQTGKAISSWVSETWQAIKNWVSNAVSSIQNFKAQALNVISGFVIAALLAIIEWLGDMLTEMSSWFTARVKDMKTWWGNLWKTSTWPSGWDSVKEWFSDFWDDIADWFTKLRKSVSNWWDNLWSDKDVTVKTTSITNSVRSTGNTASLAGHATGGIFNREHIARFAEGNKAEMIVPLENNGAMRPFVDAISTGILEGLAPTLLTSNNGGSSLPPMYVGTLIADDRGIKELYKKFEIIQMQENARRGLATT